jgi:streptogramin lyase
VLDDARVRPAPSRLRRALDVLAGAGGPGRREPLLVRPFGLAALPGGELIVADPDAGSVLRIGPDGLARPVRCPEAWGAPLAVAAGPGGALFVADGARGAVIRVEPGGRCAALGEGVLERPSGVALAGGRLAVADPPRHAIVLLDPATGEERARLGRRGEGDGELSFPTAVAAAADGSLLVVDALNFRVARFGPDGGWRGAFGEAGEAGGAFARPKAVAVGEDGRIYVSDAQRDLVLVFHPEGAFDYALGGGEGPGALALPAGLALLGDRLHVADSGNGRVLVVTLAGVVP